LRIESHLAREGHGFADGHVVDRDEMVRDELHLTAVTEGTDVRNITRKNTQDGANAFTCGFATADEDRPSSFLHASCGSTDWAIKHGYAIALQAMHCTFLVYYRQRARLDHYQARLRFTPFCATWCDFFKNVIERGD